jgi:hypothetical protein
MTTLRQAPVPDRVDALVDAMKPPSANAALDRFTTEAEGTELHMANDSVLPRGDRRDRKVDRVRVRFESHIDSKSGNGRTRPL